MSNGTPLDCEVERKHRDLRLLHTSHVHLRGAGHQLIRSGKLGGGGAPAPSSPQAPPRDVRPRPGARFQDGGSDTCPVVRVAVTTGNRPGMVGWGPWRESPWRKVWEVGVGRRSSESRLKNQIEHGQGLGWKCGRGPVAFTLHGRGKRKRLGWGGRVRGAWGSNPLPSACKALTDHALLGEPAQILGRSCPGPSSLVPSPGTLLPTSIRARERWKGERTPPRPFSGPRSGAVACGSQVTKHPAPAEALPGT